MTKLFHLALVGSARLRVCRVNQLHVLHMSSRCFLFSSSHDAWGELAVTKISFN